MCLIVCAWKTNPNYPLILGTNRDEYHSRPTKKLHWWPDNPKILGGRDLHAGGTWLALNKTGHLSAVTNHRIKEKTKNNIFRTRGELVSKFLLEEKLPIDFIKNINQHAYQKFNLLITDGIDLIYTSNHGHPHQKLKPGVYGLSNSALDTPCSKLIKSREKLKNLIKSKNVNLTSIFRILEEKKPAPVDEIISNNIPFKMARAMSAPFVVNAEYGTRSSTVVLFRRDGQIEIKEKHYNNSAELLGESHFKFTSE